MTATSLKHYWNVPWHDMTWHEMAWHERGHRHRNPTSTTSKYTNTEAETETCATKARNITTSNTQLAITTFTTRCAMCDVRWERGEGRWAIDPIPSPHPHSCSCWCFVWMFWCCVVLIWCFDFLSFSLSVCLSVYLYLCLVYVCCVVVVGILLKFICMMLFVRMVFQPHQLQLSLMGIQYFPYKIPIQNDQRNTHISTRKTKKKKKKAHTNNTQHTITHQADREQT